MVQPIDAGRTGEFLKSIVVARAGKTPIAMVRKRAAGPDGARPTRAPVLLVHGFGQNRYAWHLPSRSFANHLADAGYDVFNLDLRGHGRSRELGARHAVRISEYVDEDLPAAIALVREMSGGRSLFYVGHSMGGLCGYAAAPRLEGDLAGAIAGIVSIGSPYHFTRGSYTLRAAALALHAVHAIGVRPRGGLVRGLGLDVRALGFAMRAIQKVRDGAFYPLPIRAWHKGALEPEILEEHLRLAFDRASAAEAMDLFSWARERRFGGKRADYAARFEALDLPLLVVAGAHDDLAPPASVLPGFVRSRSPDKTYREFPLGHIDLLAGRDAPRTTWAAVTGWLDDRTE